MAYSLGSHACAAPVIASNAIPPLDTSWRLKIRFFWPRSAAILSLQKFDISNSLRENKFLRFLEIVMARCAYCVL